MTTYKELFLNGERINAEPKSVNALDSTEVEAPLAANQGKILDEKLAQEITRAELAEKSLKEALDIESQRAIAKETQIDEDLTKEAERATEAEAQIESKIIELRDQKLNKMIGPVPGEETIRYHIPFDITQEAQPDGIQIKVNTVTLDGQETIIEFAEAKHKLGIANIELDVAGLYNRELAAKKTEVKMQGGLGTSYVFNEPDGGGVKFENDKGINSYLGVHDDAQIDGSGIAGQLYVVDKADATKGCKINMEQNMFTYIKNKATSERTADDEIAVVGDFDKRIANVTDEEIKEMFIGW